MGIAGGLAMTLAGTAHADNFAVRAKPAGIEKLVEVGQSILPTTLDLDPLAGVLMECPVVSDFSASFTPNDISLAWHDLDIEVGDGTLGVVATVDVDVQGDLDATNVVCVADQSCDLRLIANQLTVTADLAMMSTPEGMMVADAVIDVRVSEDDFDLDLDSCFLGNAAEVVLFEWFEGWTLGKIHDKIVEKAGEAVPGLIESKLGSSVPLHIEKAGFHIDAAIADLGLSAALGLTLAGDADVSWMGGDGSAPEGQPADGPALPDALQGDFALAAADNLVGGALHEAWRGGVFDSALSGLAPTITLSEDGLAQKMGLPAGTELNVSLHLAKAPEVSFGRDEPGIGISLPDLRVTIEVNPPNGVSGTIEVRTIASLGVGFNVDAESGSLGLAVHKLKVDKLELESGSEIVRADPARLEQFIADVGAPMLGERLAGLPLSPALRPSPELAAYVYLRGIEAEGGWLRAGADLHTPDPNDETAPDTTAEIPAIVPAGMATVPVSGSDDTTPSGLIRYEVLIDGEQVHDEPKFMPAARLSMAEGTHTVTIAAVDLMGNIDAEPVTADVVVDGTPPTLSVTGAPPAVLTDEIVELTWQASDERTGVKTRWELKELGSKDKVGTIVAEGEAAETGTVQLEEFNRSSLYVVRVIAEDEAGNVTSEEFGFGLEQGGCSTGGGTESSLIALGLLALMLLRRRRRTVMAAAAAIGLVVTASAASAQVVGTHLSGPTDADGASAFWNPAAMSAGKGTRFDAGSGLSLVRIGFTPEGQADGSTTFIPKPSPTIGGYTDVLGPQWRLGLSIAVPSASGAEWDNDDPASDVTRYYANQAKNFYVTTTVGLSYQPAEWISIGAGPNIVYGRLDAEFDKDMAVQLNRTVGSSSADSPFPSQHPDLAAPVDLRSGGWGIGAVGGVLITPNEYLSIGTSVHSPVTVGAKGTIEAEYSPSMQRFIANAAPSAELPEMAGDVAIDLKLPLSVYSAVAVRPAGEWEIRLDHRFADYSSVSNTDVIMVEVTSPDLKDTSIVKGYKDLHSVGLRLGRSFSEGRGRAALSGRYERNKVPETVATPSNLDFDKYEVGAAVQWALSERFAMTGQYSHFFLDARDVDESLHRTLADPNLDAYNHPAPMGRYNGAADMFSVFLSAFY